MGLSDWKLDVAGPAFIAVLFVGLSAVGLYDLLTIGKATFHWQGARAVEAGTTAYVLLAGLLLLGVIALGYAVRAYRRGPSE